MSLSLFDQAEALAAHYRCNHTPFLFAVPGGPKGLLTILTNFRDLPPDFLATYTDPVVAALEALKLPPTYPRIAALAEFLKDEDSSTQINFVEESRADDRYELSLTLRAASPGLIRCLAVYFGQSTKEAQQYEEDEDELTNAEVNGDGGEWRALADEFVQLEGEFFDFTISVAELIELAAKFKA